MASFNSNGGVGDVPYGPTTPPSAKAPRGLVPKPFTPTTPADRAKNPNRVASVIGKVGDYLGNVARSARDIPTAVGTALDRSTYADRGKANSYLNQLNSKYGLPPRKQENLAILPIKNIATQVGQVATSIAGIKDTDRSLQNVSDQYPEVLGKKTRSSSGVGMAKQGNPRGGSTVSGVK